MAIISAYMGGNPMSKAGEKEFEPIDERVPEALLKRLVLDAAGQKYGTQYGRMRMRGQLNDPQFQACKWFDELYARYLSALERPRGIRTSTGEQIAKGHPPDPFSPIGLKIAADEHVLVKRYEGARMAGMSCGVAQFKLFWFVVIEDGMSTGYACPVAVKAVADAIEAYRARDSKRKGKRR
jgi:hypothetical protein